MAFIVLVIVLVLLTKAANGKETLRLGALVSSGQTGTRFDYTGFLPALKLALETINNDSSLQYFFEITTNNSKVTTLSPLSYLLIVSL